MSASTPAVSGSLPGGDRARIEVKHRGVLMTALLAISTIQFLDATIANVALPHMQTGLGASIDSISWVLTSFIIASAVATPITGWLAARFGVRTLFIAAVSLFLVASALCGAATSLTAMVIFRIFQGIGAAFIGPMVQTLIYDINPPSKQAGAISLWAAVVMVGPISGPVIGGWLTDALNWRWIYYINLPIGIPALIAVWRILPAQPLVERKLDHLGFWSLALGLGTLQLMLDRGETKDWFTSTEIVIEGIAAISLVWLYFVHTRFSRVKLFNPELFKDANFVASMGCMTIMGVATIAMSAALPTLFQTIFNYPVIDAGLLSAPRGIGIVLAMVCMNKVIRTMDPRYLISIGFALTAYGQWTMCQWSLDMDWKPIATSGLVQGLGLGLILAPLNLLSYSTLRPELRAEAASLLSLFRNLGGSLGITLIVATLSRSLQASHAALATNVTGSVIPGVDLPAAISTFPAIGPSVMMMLNGEVTRQASMIAYLDSFYMTTWVLLLFAPLPLLLRKSRKSTSA